MLNRRTFVGAVHLSVFLLLLCPASLRSAEDQATPRSELYYGLAQGTYLSGDLSGAQRGALEALRVDPEHLPAMALLARIHLDQDRTAEALELTEALVAADPDNHEFRLLHALALQRSGETAAATASIDAVLEDAAPESSHASTARHLKGLQHMAEGDWMAAAEVFGEESEGGPAGRILAGEAYAEAAAEHQARGEFAEARAALDTAIALAPPNALEHLEHLLLARARLHGSRGRFQSAVADLEAITTKNPEHLEATVMLASLYATEERWEAVERLLPGIEADPRFEDVVLYFRGRAAFSRGRIGTARARFEEALEMLEGKQSALLPALAFYRGACLLELGRTAEGDSDMLGALADGFIPETVLEARLAGAVLLRAGRPSEAAERIGPVALREAETSAALWTVLGRAHESSGEPELARSAYDQAIAIDAGSTEAWVLRAALRRRSGEIEGAVGDYQMALDSDPENPMVAYALGLAQLQSGRIPEAERSLALAAAALPGNGAVQLLYALCAFAVGDYASARNALVNHRQARTDASVNASALLLRYCLDMAGNPSDALRAFEAAVTLRNPPDAGLDLLAEFFAGQLQADEALKRAARGPDPDTSMRRFAEVGFWMAQHERFAGNPEKARSLLEAVARGGNPDLPEVRIAEWMVLERANKDIAQ